MEDGGQPEEENLESTDPNHEIHVAARERAMNALMNLVDGTLEINDRVLTFCVVCRDPRPLWPNAHSMKEWWQQSTVVRKSCAKLFAGIRNAEDLVICLPLRIPPQPSWTFAASFAGLYYRLLQLFSPFFCFLLPFTALILPFTVFYCPLLPFTALYCLVLPFTAFCWPLLSAFTALFSLFLLFAALYCPYTALYGFLLPLTALYCALLPCTALYCPLLPSTALYCLFLPSTALFCLVLPFTTL